MTLTSSKKKVGFYRFTGKTLGKGNFARVEEAVHSLLNVKVAIKIMDVNAIKEDYVIRNLYREGKIMLKLNHPCIASLYQTMQRSDNVFYLVTELVPGGDLCSFVKGQKLGRLEERQTRIYGRQFASAIAHMHGLGVVHRDLKMENVMLNAVQTQIKIVDFGLSNTWNAGTPLKTHCGSPEYAAPELFVSGKQYGAEVDLWSLGIILYGMVIGQLPFVSTKSEHVTSQERRKRLVAQINRGLAAAHRRALASFSSDFRSLVNRLLAADPMRRLTVKELVIHPWITDKGKKLLRTNPMRPLEAHWHKRIIEEISALVHIDTKSVLSDIEDEPLGKMGGMCRILMHKLQLGQLQGDGITKTLPSVMLMDSSGMSNSRDENKVKAAEKLPLDRLKKPLTSTTGRRSDFYTPRVVITNKATKHEVDLPSNSSPTKVNKNITDAKKMRPATVQGSNLLHKNSNSIDYRIIKSPTLRRKVYSANITPKTNRPFSPVKVTPKPIINKVDEPKKISSKSCSKKDTISLVNGIKKPLIQLKNKEDATNKDQQRSAPVSRLCNRKRPVTTGQQNPLLERYGGRKNLLQQHSIDMAKPSTATGGPMRAKKDLFAKPEWERNLFAFGDNNNNNSNNSKNNNRAVTAPHNLTRKPIIYDPIAKSIADYVVNNVPEKLPKFPWFRK